MGYLDGEKERCREGEGERTKFAVIILVPNLVIRRVRYCLDNADLGFRSCQLWVYVVIERIGSKKGD